MNEELKIIIKAVTDEAQKNLTEVKKELNGIQNSGTKSGKSVDAAMKGVAKGAAVAVAAVVALTAAMTKLGKAAQEVNKGFGRMKTSFENAGSSAKQATKYYKELFGILGDHDRTVETGQSLARITTDPKALNDYKNIMAGAVSQYGDGYNSEALAENISETIAAAKVTGDLERVLVEAGISADGFNAALAQTSSLEQRELMIRNTLNGVLGNAGKAYIAANQSTIAYNESQARLNITLAEAASYTTPLLTSLNNLSSTLLTFMAPALSTVAIYLTAFIQLIAEAIQWVGSFFGMFGSSTEKTTSDVSGYRAAMNKYLESLRGGFDTSSEGIQENINKLQELKKQTMGFDELNVVSAPVSAATGSAGGGASGGAGKIPMAPNPEDYGIGGNTIDIEGFKKDLEEAKDKIKVVLPMLGLIGAAVGAWKLTDFLIDLKDTKQLANFLEDTLDGMRKKDPTGFGMLPDDDTTKKMQADLDGANTKLGAIGTKLKTLGGSLLAIAGVTTTIASFSDAWVNGIDWENFAGLFAGLGLIVGALAIFFGGWGAVVGAVIGGIVALVLGIKDLITEGYNLKNGLMMVIGAMLIFPTITTTIVGAFYLLWNECEAFRNFWINLWNKIKEIAKAVADWFVEKILKPTKNIYQNWVKPVFDKIIEIIKKVIEIIGALFVGLWNLLKQKVIDPMARGFKQLWLDIKEFFAPAVNFFGDLFKRAYEKIKEKFAPIKKFFSTLWKEIKETFTNLGTIIGDAMSKAVKSGINAVIGLIEKRINAAIGLINGAIKLINKLPGVHVEKLTELELPRLATGGIVTRSTIANIGEAGREAVLPLERNTGWMDILAERIANRQAAPSRLVLMLDGRELGYATINSINDIAKQTGSMPLAFA